MFFLASNRHIDQKSKSNECYSRYIGNPISSARGNRKRVWFISYCFVVNFLRMGTWRHRRFGHFEQSELVINVLFDCLPSKINIHL